MMMSWRFVVVVVLVSPSHKFLLTQLHWRMMMIVMMMINAYM